MARMSTLTHLFNILLEDLAKYTKTRNKREKKKEHLLEQKSKKTLKITRCWQGRGATRTLCIAGGSVLLYNYFRKESGSFLKSYIPHGPSIPLLGICPKEAEHSHTDLHKNAHSSFIYNSQKLITHMSIYRKVDKQIVIYLLFS